MKPLHLLLTVSFLFANMPAIADECTEPNEKEKQCHDQFSGLGSFSGTVSFVSDYRFRGITQTDRNPAIQGSIDYKNLCGFYAGIWGSNVNFEDGDQAYAEFDLYGGWSKTFDRTTIKVGGIYYTYPGARSNLNYDYFEFMAEFNYTINRYGSITGAFYYSPEFFGHSGSACYSTIGTEIETRKCTLGAYVGYQSVEKNKAFGLPDYKHWGAYASRSFQKLELKIEYTDTNITHKRGTESAGIFRAELKI